MSVKGAPGSSETSFRYRESPNFMDQCLSISYHLHNTTWLRCLTDGCLGIPTWLEVELGIFMLYAPICSNGHTLIYDITVCKIFFQALLIIPNILITLILQWHMQHVSSTCVKNLQFFQLTTKWFANNGQIEQFENKLQIVTSVNENMTLLEPVLMHSKLIGKDMNHFNAGNLVLVNFGFEHSMARNIVYLQTVWCDRRAAYVGRFCHKTQTSSHVMCASFLTANQN